MSRWPASRARAQCSRCACRVALKAKPRRKIAAKTGAIAAQRYVAFWHVASNGRCALDDQNLDTSRLTADAKSTRMIRRRRQPSALGAAPFPLVECALEFG